MPVINQTYIHPERAATLIFIQLAMKMKFGTSHENTSCYPRIKHHRLMPEQRSIRKNRLLSMWLKIKGIWRHYAILNNNQKLTASLPCMLKSSWMTATWLFMPYDTAVAQTTRNASEGKPSDLRNFVSIFTRSGPFGTCFFLGKIISVTNNFAFGMSLETKGLGKA